VLFTHPHVVLEPVWIFFCGGKKNFWPIALHFMNKKIILCSAEEIKGEGE